MSYPILPFTFGYPLDDDGAPALGDGSDDDPLVIGITSTFLLNAAAWDPNAFVFHMDATFKPWRPCKSQRTVVQYAHALRSLMDIFKVVETSEGKENSGFSVSAQYPVSIGRCKWTSKWISCRSLIDPQENAKNSEEGERNNRHMVRLEQPMIGWTANQYWDLSM
ncbi:hypothetical protein GQ600_7877 [Phytophthora cactorum]|nr:hypothetical protein GQ600_7877 [Phytophthora cactorum]